MWVLVSSLSVRLNAVRPCVASWATISSPSPRWWLDLQAAQKHRFALVGIAVVEFGDQPVAKHLAHIAEAARLFGDFHRQQHFALLADSARSATWRRRSKFMLAPEAIATSVLFWACTLGPGLGAGNRQCAGRFQDRARVFEYILDCGADGIGIDTDDFIEELLAQAERLLPDQLDRHAVGKQADVLLQHPLASLQRLVHRV